MQADRDTWLYGRTTRNADSGDLNRAVRLRHRLRWPGTLQMTNKQFDDVFRSWDHSGFVFLDPLL